MLPRAFFQTDPLECAESLIGTTLLWGRCQGIIVETEAYLVENDEACHTFSRPSTRSFVERNKAGTCYIYFNYGVHWMLNVLVKGGPRDGLILIRALEPMSGISLMRKRRGTDDLLRLCSGPGKLTQALDITKRHHEIDLCADPRHCFAATQRSVGRASRAPFGASRSEIGVEFCPRDAGSGARDVRPTQAEVIAGPRIGISRSKDLPWRFTLRDSPFVSVVTVSRRNS